MAAPARTLAKRAQPFENVKGVSGPWLPTLKSRLTNSYGLTAILRCGITPPTCKPAFKQRATLPRGFSSRSGLHLRRKSNRRIHRHDGSGQHVGGEGCGLVGVHHAVRLRPGGVANPHDAGVLLVAQPKQRVAVMSFSGRTTPRKTERVEEKLRAAIVREGLRGSGPAVLAVYENPWTTLPFMRRNEIQINLDTSMEEA